MQAVEETRRIRLQMLVKKHGSMANFCQLLGYARTETATLTRILNANVRHDRGGKPYNMGSPMAREIEEKLSLGLGWMDTPPTYLELHGDEDPLLPIQRKAALEPRFTARMENFLQGKLPAPTASSPSSNPAKSSTETPK